MGIVVVVLMSTRCNLAAGDLRVAAAERTPGETWGSKGPWKAGVRVKEWGVRF